MSYRLADIDDLAREKILLDVSVDKKIYQGLYDAKLMGRFPQTWVFSDDYKCYMTFFPSLARPENMWINLVFFIWEGHMKYRLPVILGMTYI
jgi:hypothetical protein